MNRRIIIIMIPMLLMFLHSSVDSYAQYTIKEQIMARPRLYKEEIIFPTKSSFPVDTPGWQKELKRRTRHERNFFETKTGIMFNQFAYVNWSGGGENSYNGKFTTLNTHSYKYKKITVDSYLNAALGFGEKGGELWKTEDYFEVNTILNYQMWGKWAYSFGVNLSTQFAKGYGSNKEVYSSKFFAPGTLKPFIGISYRHSDNQIITIAPVSGNLLFVMDERLSQEGAFNVDPGKKFKATVGSYINIQWEQPIDRKKILVYKTNLQSFFDYRSNPTLGWENWINLNIFKYFTVGLYMNIVFNDKIDRVTPSSSFWQLKQNLGIGVSYNFKNKDGKPEHSKYIKMVKFGI